MDPTPGAAMQTHPRRPLRPGALLLLSSVLALGATPAGAEPRAAELREVTFRSEVFGGDRTLLVRLPPGYAAGAERYPVLYFADGDRLMPTVAGVVELLAAAGVMPELILVGLRHADRSHELTPSRGRSDGWLDEWKGFPTAGGADQLLASLEREVIPRVETTWRTEPCRLLAGHSLGGLFALHTMTARPGLFRARLAISPTLPWDGELPLRALRAHLEAKGPLDGALVVTLGDEGNVGAAAVEAHYRRLSERFGYAVPIPEGILNLAGYQALRDRSPEEALRIFQRNVALHPESPNDYDSLGEAFVQGGDLKLAATKYQRAWELAERQHDPRTHLFKANALRAQALAR
jgi:predicted alpha/beta superfamily hydrolase